MDSVITQTIEPWAACIERVPAYLRSDAEFAKKLADFRKETSIQLMDMTARHLTQHADIQKKSAARNTITVEMAIDESSATQADAEELKLKARQSVQKIVEWDSAREKKFFNQKASNKYKNEVTLEGLIDPCAAVIRIRKLPDAEGGPRPLATTATIRPPFQELGPTARGPRNRGRGPRRGRNNRPRRGRYQPY